MTVQQRLDQMKIEPGETADGTMCYYIVNTVTGARHGGQYTQSSMDAQRWLDAYAQGLYDAVQEGITR